MTTDAAGLRLLVLIQLISMAAMEMSGPFWPLQIRILLGADKLAYLGLLSALVYAGPMLAAMILTPIWGRLGDRTGHKVMIIRALLALGVSQALAGMTVDVGWLVAIRILQGALAGFIATAQAYAMVCCINQKRGQTVARLQSATAVGSLIGPLLGGWMMDASGFDLVCYSAASICLICAVAALLLPGDSPLAKPPRPTPLKPLPRGWLSALLVVIVLIQAAKIMPQPFYALYVLDILQAPGWLIGASYATSAAALAVSAPLWARLFDRWQPTQTLRLIEWVCWACALTLALSALTTQWAGFLISRLLWGVWQGALLPVAYALIANSVATAQQGLALGLGNSAAKAGALCGVIIGGIGMGVVGLANAFWMVALTYVFAASGIRVIRAFASRLIPPPFFTPSSATEKKEP